MNLCGFPVSLLRLAFFPIRRDSKLLMSKKRIDKLAEALDATQEFEGSRDWIRQRLIDTVNSNDADTTASDKNAAMKTLIQMQGFTADSVQELRSKSSVELERLTKEMVIPVLRQMGASVDTRRLTDVDS